MKTALAALLAIASAHAHAGYSCTFDKAAATQSINCERSKNGVKQAYRCELVRDDQGKVSSAACGPVTIIKLTVQLAPPKAEAQAGEANGNGTITIFADGVEVGTADIVPIDTGVFDVRIPISRAHQARYWSWQVENTAGAFIAPYSVKALPIILHSGRARG